MVKKAVSNAPKNSKMIPPEIQRDIANCFAEVREACDIILFCKLCSLSFIVHIDELFMLLSFLQIIVKSIIEEIGGDIFFAY